MPLNLLMEGLDADCAICMNSFKFEGMCSLPCGHTYCWSCIEELFERSFTGDDVSKCPECRHEFELEDVRRLFIKSCSSSNNSTLQRNSSSSYSPTERDGFIRHATHIAKRLRKMDAESPAQSMKTAVDIIEHVAIVECKEAQEILWKAVREFWLRLVPFFEQWDQCKELRNRLPSLEERLNVLDQTCSRLQLEVESERNQTQQLLEKLENRDGR
ncbi:hypothetical protein B0F90DRAFT_929774 [Multifurca ochricompacta]|uniref:RING-type domain-containing protein n=1 Tax=Multifurca ochricompacta TaxID=376703 RepID=A0AAD4QR68_9AGAM|nr:hypothetical protein B0F90DRAFT_929774 [Multifurca ochricompacta]